MNKIKAITASLMMLVGILTLALSSQDAEAKRSNGDWTKFGDIDNPNEELCKKKGNTCAPPVIIEAVIK